MSVSTVLKEVQTAVSEESAVKAEALQRGQASTRQPLTQSRLGELCDLGEKMMQATARREKAVRRLRELFASSKAGS